MSKLFGETRTRVKADYALIAEDGHVPSALKGFEGATPYFLISPAMGAGFTQMLIQFPASARARFPSDEMETVFYVSAGRCEALIGDVVATLDEGGFGFCPSGVKLELTALGGSSTVTCFRKRFEPLNGFDAPRPIFGDERDVAPKPFLGNSRALLKTLLPESLDFDLAMNIFTFEPGATLPFVETHVMEHGLLMLSGQGLYRLGDDYYPVKAGDVIWMAPYCPQWFVAMGDSPASYLYYKNINRFV